MSNSKAIGVAYEDQKIVGGTVDNTPVGATTASTGAFTTLAASGAATLSGTNTLSGATTLSGGATLSGTNTVSGATTFSNTATFNGAASFTATVTIGNSAADLVGFHGAAPVDQAAYTASLDLSGLAVSGVVGWQSSASFSVAITAINNIIALLVEKGLMAAS